jgi:tetratricopeptide (TPR) repeat protein
LFWSQRYDRQLDDVFAIQDEIARTIVDTLRATWFADLAPAPVHHYTDNVRAYGLYLKGRYEWNRRTQEGVTAGIRYFEQAIAADPSYALAYTGLADCYALHIDYRSVPVDEGFAQAKKYALQAIALNDSLAEAHASLAWCRFAYDWDWAAAGQEFRRAIELDPRYASAPPASHSSKDTRRSSWIPVPSRRGVRWAGRISMHDATSRRATISTARSR